MPPYPGDLVQLVNADELVFECLSCEVEYNCEEGGTCKEFCLKLKQRNEELESKVLFLSLSSPVLSSAFYVSSQLLLLASKGEPSASPIPTHKNVLVHRSPVFKEIFERENMSKDPSSIMKITLNVSYQTLVVFVNFLYTAEVSLDDQMACNLLALGKKYQVNNLKAYCENFFISKLTWDKSLESFAFAYKYNCENLRSASLEVIINNMARFTENNYYDELLKNNPRLVEEIYEAYHKETNTAGGIV
ncbi:hypothetical protein RJT34_09699 [Clitoria ternatea]|uniref:BTB domain-containing protein n=1 Tax=Clitoria ternatea TaxID=43366 RepID=A0AAN9K774_CLITE